VAAAAADDGAAQRDLPADLTGYVRALMWQPVYRPVRPG
jgi:hypothetical protein